MVFAKLKTMRWAHQLAVLALLFLSLAPTISRFAVTDTRTEDFRPSICTSAKSSITIDVLTTKGQRLKTTFATEAIAQQTPEHNVVLHLEHCPFCAPNGDHQWLAILPTESKTFLSQPESQWQKAEYKQQFTSTRQLGFSSRAPPAQA